METRVQQRLRSTRAVKGEKAAQIQSLSGTSIRAAVKGEKAPEIQVLSGTFVPGIVKGEKAAEIPGSRTCVPPPRSQGAQTGSLAWTPLL